MRRSAYLAAASAIAILAGGRTAAAQEEFQKPGGPDMVQIFEISAEHGIHYVNP